MSLGPPWTSVSPVRETEGEGGKSKEGRKGRRREGRNKGRREEEREGPGFFQKRPRVMEWSLNEQTVPNPLVHRL